MYDVFFSQSWRLEVQGQCAGQSSFPGQALFLAWGCPPSHCVLHLSQGEGSGSLVSIPIRALIPSQGPNHMTSSNPKYHPKTPCSDTITLGVRASIYELEGDLNIQSTTRDPQAFQPPSPFPWFQGRPSGTLPTSTHQFPRTAACI